MFRILLALITTIAFTPAGIASAEPEVDFWLTVLNNNDGESEVIPREVLDADDNVIGYQGGVAYFARVLTNARKAANEKPKRDRTRRRSVFVSYDDDDGERTKRGPIFVSSGDNFLARPSFTASLAGGGDELLANPGNPLLPSDATDDIFGPYPIIASDTDGNDVPVVTTAARNDKTGPVTNALHSHLPVTSLPGRARRA